MRLSELERKGGQLAGNPHLDKISRIYLEEDRLRVSLCPNADPADILNELSIEFFSADGSLGRLELSLLYIQRAGDSLILDAKADLPWIGMRLFKEDLMMIWVWERFFIKRDGP